MVPKSEKDERNAQTFNIPLTHNSLAIMHASCQERFKHTIPPQQTIDAFKPPFPPPPSHSVSNQSTEEVEEWGDMMPPSTSRINITFRFYRPDFKPTSIPKCQCGVPTILRPDMKKRGTGVESHPTSSGPSNGSGHDMEVMRYFWMCYAGAQNDGKGCSFFQIMDFEKEGRGPYAVAASTSDISG